MKTLITNGILLTPDERISGQTVWVEDGKISKIGHSESVNSDDIVIDAAGCIVAPGLIDLHAHGANGFDTMDATPQALQQMGHYFAQHGVTAYLPTSVTASIEETRAAIENVAAFPLSSSGAQPLGIHLEGPYFNEQYRGAQPVQHLRAAHKNEYDFWLDHQAVRLITVAPEVEGVMALIEAGVSAGVEFAVGHSGATYEEVLEAAGLGLRQVTHIFNGMPALHHRSPGVLGAALSESRLWTQVIADGIHVHPAIIRVLIAAKGIDRTLLITDSIRATGQADGDYALGDQQVHVRDGIARTDAGGLAGSTLTLDQALRNVMKFTGLSLQQALPMATRVPAAAMGLQGSKGILAPHADADIIILDAAYQVRLTMVGGRVVYGK